MTTIIIGQWVAVAKNWSEMPISSQSEPSGVNGVDFMGVVGFSNFTIEIVSIKQEIDLPSYYNVFLSSSY